MTRSISRLAMALIALTALATAQPALAGPFGLEEGTPVSKLAVSTDLGDDAYLIEVPRPNSMFKFYVVLATPGEGLCKIVAVGTPFTADADGHRVRGAYADFKAQLDGKYGHSNSYDVLKEGSRWSAPGDFARALKEEDYTLSAFWTKEDGASLPADISGIELDAASIDGQDTRLTLIYELGNFARCKAEQRKKSAETL